MPEFKGIIDNAIEKAVKSGIVVVFLHNSHSLNILPYGFYSPQREGYERKPDIRIYPFDYNLLYLPSYKKYLEVDRKPRSGNEIPYFSYSSTPIVVAAGVAMLKEVNPNLSPKDYKDILVNSSKGFSNKEFNVTGVLDYSRALETIKGY